MLEGAQCLKERNTEKSGGHFSWKIVIQCAICLRDAAFRD